MKSVRLSGGSPYASTLGTTELDKAEKGSSSASSLAFYSSFLFFSFTVSNIQSSNPSPPSLSTVFS